MAPAAQPARRIKVLYVCTALNRGSGGETHPLTLARCIDKDRFDFSVCVIESASAANAAELESAGCRLHSLNLSRRFYNPVGLMRIVHRLYRLFLQLEPDIVQTHALHANLLGRLAASWAGIDRVISTENALPDIERNLLRRALMAPFHALNRHLDRKTWQIVVVSGSVRRWKDPSGRSRKLRVIPPPFRLETFGGARAPPSDSAAPVLGVVGRLSAEKGHRFAIAAMPQIIAHTPGARLLIVGSGPLEAELKGLVTRLGLTGCVDFLGFVQEVRTAYAAMDLLLVPSLSDAFPLVILEGMMMELPVVGARTGGIAEIVLDGETGVLVPPGDSAALAKACQDLLSQPEVAKDMGRRGRRRALTEFDPAQFIIRHERLYACGIPPISLGCTS